MTQIIDNRYVLKVYRNNLTVIDTKLFRVDSPNGICVLFVGCGDNRVKFESSFKRIVAEYSIAPQNIQYT